MMINIGGRLNPQKLNTDIKNNVQQNFKQGLHS